MRVLWFTNIPMPAVDEHVGQPTRGSGHWMTSLLGHLQRRAEIQLGVATTWSGSSDLKFEAGGVTYYVLGTRTIVPRRFRRPKPIDVDLDACAGLVREFAPDLIHIHGTERAFGLLAARGLVTPPVLVTIQGLLRTVAAKYYGSLSADEIRQTVCLSDLVRRCTLLHDWRRFQRQVPIEEEILRGVHYFTGQTEWDRAHVWSVNPTARYWRVGRTLREDFYSARWQVESCRRHSVIFTNARLPLRDIESLIRAVTYLRAEFPDVELRIAGPLPARTGYGRFLHERLAALGDGVKLLGWIGPEEMARELRSSHVFAIGSHVENESNSLCEAMLVGMPCVASYAGGMPSMVESDRTGLFFPMGDPAVLAAQIRRILADDDLARRLGQAAHEAAAVRHDPSRVVQELLSAYHGVLDAEGRQGTRD